jgi:GH15 family glucan-1,4-alpha-glucosidase
MLCRRLSAAPAPLRLLLTPRPDYAQRVPHLRCASPRRVVIDGRFQLHASHPVSLHGGTVAVQIPRGEPSWAVLSDSAAVGAIVTEDKLDEWHAATLAGWRQLAEGARYDGPYRTQVDASLRMLRLLVFEETGGTAAALTTSLPEVIGGIRNFDYRYSWLRDSSIGIRALTRFEPDGTEARRYLGFVAGLVDTGYRAPLDPVAAIGGERVPPQTRLPFAGYRGSRPTWTGNKAARQFQLGSLASFLLAAKEVYEQLEPRLHWRAASAVADFLAENWQRRGNGIWEQKRRRQFTSSDVFTVCGLEAMARFAPDQEHADRYQAAAGAIRSHVGAHSRTRAGGYAAVAGEDAVDISAALFPVFGYTAASDPAMDATINELERRYCVGNALYHRHLENARARRREGAFLAGTFWIAHYWVVRGDLDRARRIIEAGLGWANDLGMFPEEIDGSSGAKLGNVPLGLVHASFLAAIADYNLARLK